MDVEKIVLISAIQTLALEYGDFTLRSGEKSNFYLDCRKVVLDPSGLFLVVNSFFDRIKKWELKTNLEASAIGGPCIGADPIIGGMVYAGWSQSARHNRRGFLVRPQPKDHGQTGRLIGKIVPGEKVIIIDDVATKGESLLSTVEYVKSLDADVIKVMCIIDREAGAKELFESRGIPFESLVTLAELGLK